MAKMGSYFLTTAIRLEHCQQIAAIKQQDRGHVPQRQTLLAHFGLITSIEQRQVAFQTTLVDDLVIPLLVVRSAEQDIVLKRTSSSITVQQENVFAYSDGLVLNPRLLRSVRDAAIAWELHIRLRSRRNVMHFPLSLLSVSGAFVHTIQRLTKQGHQH